jgi:hypothetical protein
VKQGIGPSVACVRVCAERRRHDHGGDTKMMACTRQGNRERENGEERPGGVGWGHTPANDLACAWVRVHRFGQEGQGLDPVLVCAGKRSAAQPWRWNNVDNMCTTRVCVHTTPGQIKAGPSLDGGVLSVWVPTASRNSACARRNKGTTPLQGKGAHAATTAAAPVKRPARLDGRLSSDGGSARRRGAGQRSTNKQRAHKARSSLGSKAGSTAR